MNTIITTSTIRCFGVTREITGSREIQFQFSGSTVGELRAALAGHYPEFNALRSLMIAVNSSYAADDLSISPGDEIALIPPVSGG